MRERERREREREPVAILAQASSIRGGTLRLGMAAVAAVAACEAVRAGASWSAVRRARQRLGRQVLEGKLAAVGDRVLLLEARVAELQEQGTALREVLLAALAPEQCLDEAVGAGLLARVQCVAPALLDLELQAAGGAPAAQPRGRAARRNAAAHVVSAGGVAIAAASQRELNSLQRGGWAARARRRPGGGEDELKAQVDPRRPSLLSSLCEQGGPGAWGR